tara:strand:- start:551 stop:733 length:183 start_codon:yes stop_codon:yes gene_type:complete
MRILYLVERGLSSLFLIFPTITSAPMPEPMCDDLTNEAEDVVCEVVLRTLIRIELVSGDL